MDDKILRIVSIGSAGSGSYAFCGRGAGHGHLAHVSRPRWACYGGVCRAIAAILLLWSCGCHHAATDPEAGKEGGDEAASVTVRVEPVQRRAMSESIEGLGRCEALPGKIATLTSAVEGRVLDILVKPAAEVNRGSRSFNSIERSPKPICRRRSPAATRCRLRCGNSRRCRGQKSRSAASWRLKPANGALSKAEAAAKRLRPLRARNEIPEQQMFEAGIGGDASTSAIADGGERPGGVHVASAAGCGR